MSEYSFIKWSEQTQEKNKELIMLQVRDALKTFLTPEYLANSIRMYEEKAGMKLEHPIDAVKNVSREFRFSQEKEQAILNYFFESGDNTRFGLVQAVTLYAHKNADADDQFDMESMVPVLVETMPKYDTPFIDNLRGKK